MSEEQVVTVGVDTHTDVHVAAVLDQAGRLLGTASFPALNSLAVTGPAAVGSVRAHRRGN